MAIQLSIRYHTGGTRQCNKAGKKGLKIGKEEVKLLFANNIIVFVKNPKESTKKKYIRTKVNWSRSQDIITQRG